MRLFLVAGVAAHIVMFSFLSPSPLQAPGVLRCQSSHRGGKRVDVWRVLLTAKGHPGGSPARPEGRRSEKGDTVSWGSWRGTVTCLPTAPRGWASRGSSVAQRQMQSLSEDQELWPEDSQPPWSFPFPVCAFPPAVLFSGVPEDLPPSEVPPAGLMPECVP